MIPPIPLALPLADTVIVPQMEGVTTAIVGFIFVCVVYPHLVKNRTQFYAAFACALMIILLHTLNLMIGRESAGFQVFAGAMVGLFQIVAILLLFTGCGGVTLREVAGGMARAYEVIRRGEEEKTVIVPLTGEMPKPRQAAAPSLSGDLSGGGAPGGPEKLDLPPTGGWPKKPSDPPGGIPLE